MAVGYGLWLTSVLHISDKRQVNQPSLDTPEHFGQNEQITAKKLICLNHVINTPFEESTRQIK